jgi:hypothetical protein
LNCCFFRYPGALELVVAGVGEGGEGDGVPGTEFAGVEADEFALVVVGADAGIQHHARFVQRLAGHDGDDAAGGGGGGTVHVGGTLVDGGRADHLGIRDLVGEDGIVAGVVQRHAIPGERDVIAVKAMDADVAARIAVRIVVGEVEARHLVQHLEHRLAGGLLVDEVLGDGGTFLGHRDRLHDAGNLLLARHGDGFDRVFDRLGRGGLGQDRPRHCQQEQGTYARHQNLRRTQFHVSSPLFLRAGAQRRTREALANPG